MREKQKDPFLASRRGKRWKRRKNDSKRKGKKMKKNDGHELLSVGIRNKKWTNQTEKPEVKTFKREKGIAIYER